MQGARQKWVGNRTWKLFLRTNNTARSSQWNRSTPGFQGRLQRLRHWSHLDSSRQKLRGIENAIRARGFSGKPIKLLVIGPKFEGPPRLQDFLNHFDNLASRDEAWIGGIVDAKWSSPLP